MYEYILYVCNIFFTDFLFIINENFSCWEEKISEEKREKDWKKISSRENKLNKMHWDKRFSKMDIALFSYKIVDKF